MSALARRWMLILLLVAAYAIAYDGDINGNLDFFHEGDRLAHMDKLAGGGLPFRDIYVQQGLGENILKPALAFKIWGPSVASLRRVGENAYIYRGYLPPLGLVATLIAVFSLTQSLVLTTVTAAFLLCGWYEITERHALGMLAVACGGCYLQCRGQHWVILAGLLSALAAIYSLEVGLYCGTAIFVWLLIDLRLQRPKRSRGVVIGFLLGVLVPISALVLWCAWHGITRDFLYNVYCQLFMRSAVVPASYPVARPGDGIAVFAQRLILYYLLPITLLISAVFSGRGLRTKYSDRCSALLLASLLGLAFWVSVWGRPDVWHVAYMVGPFVIYAAVLVGASGDKTTIPSWPTILFMPTAICLAALLAIGSGGAVGRWLGYSSSHLPPNLREPERDLVTCDLPRLGGVRIGRVQAGFVNSLVSYIHQHSRPDEKILDLSDFGLIYFLAERQAPTRFHLVRHVGNSSLRNEMAKEVEKNPPALIIRNDEPLNDADVLDQFVARYYVRDASIGTLQLWLRK